MFLAVSSLPPLLHGLTATGSPFQESETTEDDLRFHRAKFNVWAMKYLSRTPAPMDGLTQIAEASETPIVMSIRDDYVEKEVDMIVDNSHNNGVSAEKKSTTQKG